MQKTITTPHHCPFLANEILLHIFSFLAKHQLEKTAQVNKRFSQLTRSEQLAANHQDALYRARLIVREKMKDFVIEYKSIFNLFSLSVSRSEYRTAKKFIREIDYAKSLENIILLSRNAEYHHSVKLSRAIKEAILEIYGIDQQRIENYLKKNYQTLSKRYQHQALIHCAAPAKMKRAYLSSYLINNDLLFKYIVNDFYQKIINCLPAGARLNVSVARQ